LTELQAERSTRRLEKKERKLLEMKSLKELSQKRRITEQIPKSIQWKDGVPMNKNQIEMTEAAQIIEADSTSNINDKNDKQIIENIEKNVNESISFKSHRNSARILDNSVLRQRPMSRIYGGSMRNSGRFFLLYSYLFQIYLCTHFCVDNNLLVYQKTYLNSIKSKFCVYGYSINYHYSDNSNHFC
jgi:hypothetical protein